VTSAAAVHDALPAWVALNVHVPADFSVSAVVVTLQTAGVFDVILTVRPELEVAVTAGVDTPNC
jgi:hypothetical protein